MAQRTWWLLAVALSVIGTSGGGPQDAAGSSSSSPWNAAWGSGRGGWSGSPSGGKEVAPTSPVPVKGLVQTYYSVDTPGMCPPFGESGGQESGGWREGDGGSSHKSDAGSTGSWNVLADPTQLGKGKGSGDKKKKKRSSRSPSPAPSSVTDSTSDAASSISDAASFMSDADKKAAKKARQHEAKAKATALAAPPPLDPIPETVDKVIITCVITAKDSEVTWPKVRCMYKTCTHVEKWSKMLRWKEFSSGEGDATVISDGDSNGSSSESDGEAVSGAASDPKAGSALSGHRGAWKAEGDDNAWRWVYRCVCCVAKDKGMTIAEAKSFMEANDKMHLEKVRRGQEFARIREQVQKEWPMVTSYKKLKVITLSFMEKLIAPLAEYILRKAAALEKLQEQTAQAEALQCELRACTDAKRALEIVTELEALREQQGYLAFADKGEAQHRYIAASSYNDEWTSTRGLGSLRSYYICRKKVGYEVCGGLMTSKKWTRMLSDPTAVGQRWYCALCGARYATSSGCLIEITRRTGAGGTEVFYGTASVPEWDLEDVRAMKMEQEHKDVASAQHLFSLCTEVRPQVTPLMRPVRPDEMAVAGASTEGVYRITDLAAIDRAPAWDWWSLLGVAKPEKKTKRRR